MKRIHNHPGRSPLAKVIAAALFAAPVLGTSAIASAAVRAELRPEGDLGVDEPAQLVITTDRQDAQAPSVHLRDATVRYSGESTQTSIVNGNATSSTSFIYTIVPHRTGALDIPPITVGGEQTAAVHATVANNPSPPPARARAQGQAAAPATATSSRAFLRVDMPKRALVVGESVPVTIRAYFRAGVAATLQGNPTIASPAFTLSQLSDKPAQTQVEIDGVPYLQATWTGVVSPAKPTTDKVTVELPVEIAYRERRQVQPQQQRPHRSLRDVFGADPFGTGVDPFADMDSMFDDPFFNQDFDSMFDMGAVQRQTVTLRATLGKGGVVDLPEDGKPTDFGGAVGDFALKVEPPKEELRVGEPATLTFTVTGHGNFDRVAVAGIPASADWKTYPGKTTFESAGARDLAGGTKTFTQTVVPTHPGQLTVPAVSLAYYDPAAKAYRTTTTAPFTLTVAGAPAMAVSAAAPEPPAPVEHIDSSVHATLVPWIRQPSFWWWPGLIGGATALLLGAAWWRRSAWTDRLARKRHVDRRVAAELKKLDAAARHRDAGAFFEAARRAFQIRLASEWGVAPETITAADVATRLGDEAQPIRDIFEHADGVAYAPGIATPGMLDRWRTVVDAELANLEASR